MGVIQSTSVGCPLSPYTGQMGMSDSDKGFIIQSTPIQVFIRRGTEVRAFTIRGLNDLWTCIKAKWGDIEGSMN
jgi:hypothetical protein